jgi:hypothetical protein
MGPIFGTIFGSETCSALMVRFSHTEWNVNQVVFVDNPAQTSSQPVLVLMLAEDPQAGFDFGQVVVLSLKDGSILGRHVKSDVFFLLGVTRQNVWVQFCSRFHIRTDEIFAYSLPKLKRLYSVQDLLEEHREIEGIVQKIVLDGKNDTLRVYARNGYQYQLNSKNNSLKKLPLDPAAPRWSFLLGDDGICGNQIIYPDSLYDHLPCQKIVIEGDHIQLNRDSAGKLVLKRRSPESNQVWSVGEDEMFGFRDQDDPEKSLFWSTYYNNTIYTLASDGDDIYVNAINPKDGSTIWCQIIW